MVEISITACCFSS